MDNTTILAIAVLAAVLVYFLILRKPSPPHPVENRCLINRLNIEDQIKKQSTSMLTFYILFVNKYGPNKLIEDPVHLSLANIVMATSSKKLDLCRSYQDMETLIDLFLKNAKITHPEENRNVAVMMEPAHGDDLAKYVMYVDFFEKISASIKSEKLACCAKH